MLPFDFQCPTRIVFGPGKVAELGRLAADLGAKRALLVSDAGIVAAGHATRGVESLQNAGLDVTLFDAVQENPTTDHVNAGLAVAKEVRPDLIIGFGGGSSMDCAKGINFVYSCGGRMQDYWGEGKATGPLLSMIAVPTTAGTGSETQSYALVADAATHVKMACGDKRAAFRIAILDPVLTLTQPQRVTALTGIDALAHAIESYVSKRRSSLSQAFSREAWHYLAPNIRRVLSNPDDLEARSAMQLGACLAGLAIENSMLGAAHALANPLTANFGIAHGEAIAVMLPHVVRHNGTRVAEWYGELSSGVSASVFGENSQNPVAALSTFVEDVSKQAGLAATLEARNIPREDLPRLATEASKQWTGKFNPVELGAEDFLKLYEAAF
jgi:alcohol dehydrogenase